MIIGVTVFELHVNGCRSLKDKRRVLKSLKDRLRQKFNVSVAETAHQDTWQHAEIACCVVSTDRRHVESVLSRVDGVVASAGLVRIIDSHTSYV